MQLAGQDVYAAYAPIDGTTWNIVLVADKDETLAGVYHSARIQAFLFLIAVLLSIFVARLISSTIAKELGLSDAKVKKALETLKIEPVGKRGVCKLYAPEVIEEIRKTLG